MLGNTEISQGEQEECQQINSLSITYKRENSNKRVSNYECMP